MRQVLGTTILLIGIGTPLLATQQRPELLLWNGKFYTMNQWPLEDRRERTREDLPSFDLDADGSPTSCFRGYEGVWEIREGTLYLKALKAWVHGRRADLRELFPKEYKPGGVEATWFSGYLRVYETDDIKRPTKLMFKTGKLVKTVDLLQDDDKWWEEHELPQEAAGTGADKLGKPPRDPGAEIDRLKEHFYQLEERHRSLFDRLERVERARTDLLFGPTWIATTLLSLPSEDRQRFHTEKLDLRGKSPFGAQAMAEADVAAGHLNILTGMFSPYPGETVKVLREKHDIRVYSMADDLSGCYADDFVEAYNKVSLKAVDAKLGRGGLKKLVQDTAKKVIEFR